MLSPCHKSEMLVKSTSRNKRTGVGHCLVCTAKFKWVRKHSGVMFKRIGQPFMGKSSGGIADKPFAEKTPIASRASMAVR